MLTTNKARKILGKMAEKLSDTELEQEIQNANFLAELVLNFYDKSYLRKGQSGGNKLH